jgi:flagellar hook-associated protein 3 FlgL
MRISTSMVYELGVSTLQQRQQDQLALQQKISTGRRVMAPSDDPIAASAALNVRQSQALNQQYKTNGDTARNQLSLEESALADITTLLQDVRTLAVNAGNPVLTNTDRAALAIELEGRYNELMGIANRGDGNSQYLFSGYQGSTRPFTETAPGVVAYSGDAGQRLTQIGPARTLAVNDSGDAVFRAIRNGNGTFAAAAAASNSGAGIIDAATLTDPMKWNSAANARDFSVRFHVSGGATTYDIVDNVNNVSMLTGAAPGAGPYLRSYTPGASINLATQTPPDTNPTAFDFGANLVVSGAPANGDSFSVAASTSQDMFTTVHNLIAALRTGTSGSDASSATYHNTVNTSLNELDNALNNVLKTRASVGARLKEVDTAQTSADDVDLQYTETLSGLQDLDYTKAVSELSQQQVYLQAAQQSFLRITKLNLFELL